MTQEEKDIRIELYEECNALKNEHDAWLYEIGEIYNETCSLTVKYRRTLTPKSEEHATLNELSEIIWCIEACLERTWDLDEKYPGFVYNHARVQLRALGKIIKALNDDCPNNDELQNLVSAYNRLMNALEHLRNKRILFNERMRYIRSLSNNEDESPDSITDKKESADTVKASDVIDMLTEITETDA